MAQSESQAPLWLELKSEYIDGNFDKVLDYLYRGNISSSVRDAFYNTTIDLLAQRVQELISSIERRPISEDEEEDADKEGMTFSVRLLATYLLIQTELSYEQRLSAYVTMLSCLGCIVPANYQQELIGMSVKLLLGTVESESAFSWSDIISFRPQVLAHKIINSQKASKKAVKAVCYSGKGTLIVEKGTACLSAASIEDFRKGNYVPSFSVFEDSIQVLTPKEEKLKKSLTSNMESLDEFTHGFIASQRESRAQITGKPTKTYSQGDSFCATITSFGHDGIKVKSSAEDYVPFEGTVKIEQSILYFDYEDFKKNLRVGDDIQVELVDSDDGICSIDNEFVKYIADEVAAKDYGEEVLAYCINDTPDKKGTRKLTWITDNGYPVHTPGVDEIHKGDYAYVKILKHGVGKFYGYIDAEFVEKAADDDTIDIQEAREITVNQYAFKKKDKADAKVAEQPQSLPSSLVKELGRMLVAYQHNLTAPSERYRILCVARILSELTGNVDDSSYIKFISDYLEDLVLFAKGEIDRMSILSPESNMAEFDSVSRRVKIVSILKAYGDNSRNDYLGDIIDTEQDKLLQKIAILVQSCNRIDDVISKSMQNVIKREIIKCLSFETEGETDLEEENGIYLGIENSRQEFKTSFFHAPKNAAEQSQKINIFKGVCAFLNSQAGGTLFIGVDDLGYVKGIDSDLEYMEKNISGNYHKIDGYIRYITDEAKRYFDLGVLTHVSIESMYDDKVVAITVTPYEYQVVTLEGVAYIRLNNESVIMNDSARRQVLGRHISTNKDREIKVTALMEAIRDKRKVKLHKYKSSHSGKISDRIVEPFALTTGYTHFWCYDLKREDSIVLGTSRAESIEILEDHWENEQLHHQQKMDAFHMTGEEPIHVTLELNLMAKNLLCEEFPDSQKSLAPTGDDNRWLFDADIYQIEGLGRFYIGLAENIRIIDAPQLEEYVKAYVKKNFS